MEEQPTPTNPITAPVSVPEDAGTLERERQLAEEQQAAAQQEGSPMLRLLQFVTSMISAWATGVWNSQKENYAKAGETEGRKEVDGVVAGGINGLGQGLSATWMTMGQWFTAQKGTMREDSPPSPPRDKVLLDIGGDRNSTAPNTEELQAYLKTAAQQQGESPALGELSPSSTPQVAQSQSREVPSAPTRRL